MPNAAECNAGNSHLPKVSPKPILNLRSELAQEIISGNQSASEKWALLIVLAILLLILTISWFIKFPDTIETRATLTAANAPKEIVCRLSGRIEKLLHHNNEQVAKGTVIGWMESSANPKEILELSQLIDSSSEAFNEGRYGSIIRLFNKQYKNLGEIQQSYSEFTTALQIFNDYMVNGFYDHKKRMLEDDLAFLRDTKHTIQGQKVLTKEDIDLEEDTYKSSKLLFDSLVLSKEELKAEKSRLISKRLAMLQLDISVKNNVTQERDKIKELYQLEHDISHQRAIFFQSLLTMKSIIEDWKKKYVLQSPIDGQIFFIVPLQENQYIESGKLLGYISPGNTMYFTEMNLPQENFGKIDTGLKVQFRFSAYPFQELGYVKGTLNYVSPVASDSGFLATARLDNGLITNNEHIIPYKAGLKAHAIVITKDLRLLQRMYYGLIRSTSVGK